MDKVSAVTICCHMLMRKNWASYDPTSRMRLPPVSDHPVLTFWVVAYGRFDCNNKIVRAATLLKRSQLGVIAKSIYILIMIYYSISDTSILGEKKIRVLLSGVEPMDLPITSSDALLMSYKRLVGASS